MKFTVLRDTREKPGNGWIFNPSESCNGTVIKTLQTGDYTIEGWEERFVIERKGSLSEFATNINEKRFWNELDRMEVFDHPILLLQFSIDNLMQWPYGAGIPSSKLKYIKVTNRYILSKINEITVNYKTKVIFAGEYGQDVAYSIFKRIVSLG